MTPFTSQSRVKSNPVLPYFDNVRILDSEGNQLGLNRLRLLQGSNHLASFDIPAGELQTMLCTKGRSVLLDSGELVNPVSIKACEICNRSHINVQFTAEDFETIRHAASAVPPLLGVAKENSES